MSLSVGTRVYPKVLPSQVTLPAVVYRRISTTKDRVLSGSNGYKKDRFQFTSWANSYEEARSLADEIISLLEDFSGTIGGITIQVITVAGEVDNLAAEPQRYGIATDFMVVYS